ncbi:hypothetical protein DFH09DRAFT_1319850 [Mycena vulgaris]|nr:hypothetical protein DFH09DRAFT_1319850 [Mycena vulgaris]
MPIPRLIFPKWVRTLLIQLSFVGPKNAETKALGDDINYLSASRLSPRDWRLSSGLYVQIVAFELGDLPVKLIKRNGAAYRG